MDTRVALAACVVLGSALCGRVAADAVRRIGEIPIPTVTVRMGEAAA